MRNFWLLVGTIASLLAFAVFYWGEAGLGHADRELLTTDWHAFDGVLLSPEDAVSRAEEGRAVSFPDFFTGQDGPEGAFGAATYIRFITLPEGARCAITPGRIRYVYRYYAVPIASDGRPGVAQFLGGNGIPGLSPSEASVRQPPGPMPLDAFSGKVALVVHASNHLHFQGGFLAPPDIRDTSAALRASDVRFAAIMLYAGLFMTMGFYTILLASWHAGETYYYSGGIMLILISIRLVLLQDYEWVFMPGLDFAVSLRLEYLTFFSMLPFLYALAFGLFRREASRVGACFLFVVAGVFCLGALFAPVEWVIRTRNAYMLVAGITVIMVLLVFLRARGAGRDGAMLSLLAWFILVLAMAADAAVAAAGTSEQLENVPIGAFAFAVILMWLFTNRYRKDQAERTALSDYLSRANIELEDRAAALNIAQARAADAVQIKSSFLANISHEIRTPLNAIIGFSDLLITQSHGPVDGDKLRDYLKLIRNNGQQLLLLMSDILSVSDLEAGRFDVAYETFAPADVLDMAVSLVAPAAREKHIFLDTNCASKTIVGDVRIMRQALIKVLSNAVKYAPDNGVVTVRGMLVEEEFLLRITDTGAGMDQEEVKAALSVFGRRGDAYKAAPNGGGLGVGLPLVSRLMALVDGRMQIESIPEVGTTVTLHFRVSRPAS